MGDSSRVGDRHGSPWLELTKPRLSLLSVLTALAGYGIASGGERDLLGVLVVFAGTSAAAGGAAALNQWMERGPDAAMHRTRGRPLPEGRIGPAASAWFGVALSLGGSALLAAVATPLAGALALGTVLLYLLAYTPLKRITVWNTEVGAIPGAMPPLLGYAAATGSLDAAAWVLFAVLATWQIPHFMAIAWLYREDYARGGFVMAGGLPDGGRHLLRQTLLGTLALVVSSLATVPLIPGAGAFTLAIAGLAGAAIAFRTWQFVRAPEEHRDHAARKLFLASLLHLPLVLAALVGDVLAG